MTATQGSFRAWIIWFLAACFYLYEFFVRVAPGVMEHQLQTAFHTTGAVLGAALGAYYYIYAPMQLAVGMIFDHLSVRKALIPAVFFVAAGSLVCHCSDSLTLFTVGRILQGFGSAFAFVGAMFLAKIWFPIQCLALLAGLTTALGMIGAMVGNAGIASAVHKLGWRATWADAGIFGLFLAVALLLLIPRLPPWEKKRRAREREAFGMGLNTLVHRLRVVFLNFQIWVTGFISCTLYLPLAVFGAMWGDDFVVAMTGCSTNQASMAVSMLYVGWLVGGPISGHLSDYLSTRKQPLVLSCILTTLFLCLLLFLPIKALWPLYVLIFLVGLTSSIQVVCFVVGLEVAPEHAGGTALAGINMITMLLGGLCQPAAGYILDWSSGGGRVSDYSVADFRLAMLMLPVMTLLGLLACLFLKESYVEEVEEEVEELAEEELLL